MDALTIVARAGTSFIILASIFSFLGWYTRFGSDPIYRRNLDKLWDALEALSLFEVLHRFFRRLVRRSQETFAGRNRLFFSIILASLVLNALSVFLILELYARFEKRESGYRYLSGIASHFGLPAVAYVLTTIIVLASLPDVISLWVTWRLVTRAAEDTSLRRIVAHVAIDVLLSFVALCWAFIVFVITEHIVDVFFQRSPLRGAQSISRYFLVVFQGFSDRPWLAAAVTILGLNSALPTLLYMATCSLLLLCYSAPDSLRRFASKCVFLVSSDERPLFSQLGRILGGMAAVVTACISLLGGVKAPKPTVLVSLPPIEHPCRMVLDSLLAHDSRKWGFREYQRASVAIYDSKSVAAQRLRLRGSFGYTEFRVPDKIAFWADGLSTIQGCQIIKACWHTLGGKDCTGR